MTKERVETLSKLAREYGFQTLYAVATLFVGLPWLAVYVLLPIANDHRQFLKATIDTQARLASVQEHQSMTLDRIERFVEVHCREQTKLQQAVSKAKP